MSQHAYNASLSSSKGGLSIETGETSETAGSEAIGAVKKSFLGDYEVSSMSEWRILMMVLLSMQLTRLCCLLNKIKSSLAQSPNGAYFGSLLTAIERRVHGVAARVTCKKP